MVQEEQQERKAWDQPKFNNWKHEQHPTGSWHQKQPHSSEELKM